MGNLSLKAEYLLGQFKQMKEPSDTKMLSVVDMGVSSYYKYKKELKDKGYLSVKQIGKSVYEYKVNNERI